MYGQKEMATIKRIESETLDYIKIDITETTAQIHDQDL